MGMRLSRHRSLLRHEPETEGSIDQCLHIVREISDENRSVGRHLDTKTGSVAGFAAVTLALNATLSRPLLDDDLGRVAEPLIHLAFALATVALLACAVAALVGVLSPKPQFDVTYEQLGEFSGPPYTTSPPVQVKKWWLERAAEIAQSDRLANRRRAKSMRIAVISLVIALVAITSEAAILGITA